MSFISVLRDGENVGEAALQRIEGLAYALADCPVVGGVGTGFSAGVVGKMNGAAGANPNHFSVQANGSNLVITIQPGWLWIVKDNGNSTYDPKLVYVLMNAATTFTLAGNSQGTSRTDTICLRFDQTIAPDSQGTNLPSIVQVQGGASNALGNAPSDGALYLPLANIVIATGAASVSQSNVTDKRFVHPSQARVVFYMNANTAGGKWTNGVDSVQIPFDTIKSDPSGNAVTGTNASWKVPLPGVYMATVSVNTSAWASATGQIFCGIFGVNGAAPSGHSGRRDCNQATGEEGVSEASHILCLYGDSIFGAAFQSSGANVDFHSNAMFTAQWIGW